MSKCNCIQISRKMIRSDFFVKDKGALFLFCYLLGSREIETNSKKIYFGEITWNLKEDEEQIKKKLFKLKKEGYIELYKTKWKSVIIVAFRKREDLYKIGDFELFLDENSIIQPPKNYSRRDKGYDKFRKAVLKRDNHTCQLYGAKENLEVHHKKAYAKYIKLRTTVSNGITLCEKCHDKVHSKGGDLIE